MKPLTTPIVNPEVEHYAEAHTTPECDALAALDRWAHLHTAHPHMVAGPYQGRLLEMIARMVNPHRAIEIGSFVGYSTICLARALAPGGMLHAIEAEEEYEDVIRRALASADVSQRVTLLIGPAL